MMEEAEKWVLFKTRNEIIQDLQPKYILAELLDLGVVTKKQEKEIMSFRDEEAQAKALLGFIENGGQEAFNGFKKSLKTNDIYDWLAENIQRHQNQMKEISECNLKNLLIRGGVPSLAPKTIRRTALLKTLKEKLVDLGQSESGWVTLHGMGGLGKTMLAAAAVRDLLLIHHMFPHGVYWIKIGRKVSEDNLMSKMHALCEKMDSTLSGKIPCDVEMAADRLRNLFGSDQNQCLVVLDDVWSDLAIKHFDLGCRVLVTTRDRSVMEVTSADVAYVELTDGFTLEETKCFFASTHNLNVDELPNCVPEIWNTAKGYPLVMAIINSKVGDHSKNIDEAFMMCLGKLRNRSLITQKNSSSYDYKCISQALEMSVDTLGDLKDKYFDLAIFPDDCYIGRDVLATLWGRNQWDVEEIMNSFTDKALAMQVPNGHHTIYYTIHDMYLQFLEDSLGDSLHVRHKRLIEKYLNKSEGRFDKITHDGYILLYLGYHLSKGHFPHEKFSEIFLDLKFILVKLAAAGPADLLGDYDRYRIEISQNGKYKKKLNDFEEFVRSCSSLLTNPNYDMLQVALSQPPISEVYQQATRICLEKPEKPYFIWCNKDKLGSPCKLSTKFHPNGNVCLSVLADNRHIASGGSDGVIKVCECSSGRIVLVLKGHSDGITGLTNYKENSDLIIISSSADQTVRVWRISQQDFKSKKKNRANTIFSSLITQREHKAPVASCSVYQKDKKVASFDDKDVIMVWKVESGEIVSSWDTQCSYSQCGGNTSSLTAGCEFTRDGQGVITAKNSVLRLWDIKKQIPIWEVLKPSGTFTSCHVAPNGKEVLATFNSSLVIYDVETAKLLSTLPEPRGRLLHSCSISLDGEYIAAGNMENAVIVWDKKQHKAIDYLYGHKDNVNSVAFMSRPVNEEGMQLASAAADGTVMIWKTNFPTRRSDAVLKEIYSVQCDNNGEPKIAVADMNNQIQVIDVNQDIISGEVTSSKPNFSISCCALSHKCDRVLFGSSMGNFQIFLVDCGTTLKVGKLQKEITCCAFSKNDVNMAAGANDGIILIFTMDNPKWTYGHCHSITHIAFFYDDLRLISCSFDGNLIVWSVSEGNQICQCSGHADSIVSCDVDGERVVSASTDKTFRIWSGEDGECYYTSIQHSACVRCVKFNSGGTMLLSGDDLGNIRLWLIPKYFGSTKAGDNVVLLRLVNNCATESWISDLCFSGDGSRFVVCSDAINWWSTDEVVKAEDSIVQPLQSFPIRGRKVGKIFCSDDFETFITMDDTGVLYCLNLLKKF